LSEWYKTQKDKLLPNVCYSKAFWVLLPIVLVSGGSVFGAIYAQVEANEDSIKKIENILAENNVPALKQFIEKEFDEQELDINEIKSGVNANYRLLCKITSGEC